MIAVLPSSAVATGTHSPSGAERLRAPRLRRLRIRLRLPKRARAWALRSTPNSARREADRLAALIAAGRRVYPHPLPCQPRVVLVQQSPDRGEFRDEQSASGGWKLGSSEALNHYEQEPNTVPSRCSNQKPRSRVRSFGWSGLLGGLGLSRSRGAPWSFPGSGGGTSSVSEVPGSRMTAVLLRSNDPERRL